MASREQNVEIFLDTQQMFSALRREIQASIAGTVLFPEGQTPALPEKRCAHTELLVSRRRSLQAAGRYPGRRVAVHNFASASNPGGGVVHGARAQEESICRCSTLYPVLKDSRFWNDFYQYHRNLQDNLHTDRTLYSPGILVLKTDEDLPRRLRAEQRYPVDVITCAAPNLRPGRSPGRSPTFLPPDKLFHLHVQRARHMLAAAVSQGAEVLILGAFGCGAFSNPPEAVAKAYLQVLRELDGIFPTVEFAVYCPPGDSTNYDVFSRVLSAF